MCTAILTSQLVNNADTTCSEYILWLSVVNRHLVSIPTGRGVGVALVDCHKTMNCFKEPMV